MKKVYNTPRCFVNIYWPVLLMCTLPALPFHSFAQINGGIIGKSQCVTSGGTPSAFTSIRDATSGTISWQSATNSSFTSGVVTIGGASSQTYTEGAVAADKFYRRVLTSGATTVYSNVIKVSVVGTKTDPSFTPTILALPEICQQTTTFSVGYTTTNVPDKYSIFWDATANAEGFVDAVDATLGVTPGTLNVAVPSGASANTYNGTLVAFISGSGCTTSNISAVKVNSLPNISITAPTAICSPGTIDITALAVTSGSSPTSGMNYTQWNNASATSSLTNASSITVTGVYYIKGTISTTGCAVTKPVTATINPLPTVVVSAQVACTPGTIDLTSPSITSSGSTANLSYTQWNNATATSSLTNAAAITATGVYYIKGTIAATSCSVTKPVTATINTSPTVTISPPSAICLPGTIDLTSPSITSAGSTANLSYTQWNNASATSSLVNANAITVTGVYYIKGTIAATGCAVTKSVTATINSLPTVVITTPSVICAPGSIDLTNPLITSTGSTANLSYTQWNNASATSSLSNANAVTATGVYYIKGTIPATGCGVVKQVTVTVNPIPTVVISSPASICSPGSIDLTNPSITSAGSTANLSYTQWNNTSATSSLSNANAVTATGVYFIKGTIPATGCGVVKPVTVTVNTSPNMIITNPTVVCAPLTINLTAASVTNGSTPGLAYTYWSNAANTNPVSTPSSVNTSGVYYIKGTIPATGCAVSQPVTVTVNPQPNGILQNPSVNYICNGSSLLLNAANAFAYQWYRDGQPISGAVADNYSATVGGDYTVRFVSQEGCIKDAVNTITLNLLSKPVLQYKLSSSCAGSPISFTNGSVITSSGNINWQWDFGEGGVSTIASPVYTYANGGNYSITLTANNTSCSTLTEKTIVPFTIESPRIPTRYADVIAVGGVPIQLTSRNAGNVYLWQPSTGLNNAAMQFPTATLDKDLEYTITINSNAGCMVTDTVLVKVALDGFIYVGQGFTPNGDGMNDRCYPITAGIRSLTYFKIFNRWGNLVFQTNDATPQNGWDGKYNGKIQPAGTYQWVAEAIDGSGNIIKRTGAVLLIN